MATTNLFTDPVFKDGAFTSHDAEVRGYAVQKTMRAMDLGVSSAPAPTCSGAARRGEADAGKDPVEAIKRFREAIDFLCEYARDQSTPALRARGQAQRAARRHVLSHHGGLSGLHPDARAPGDGGRQPGVRARADGRARLVHAVAQALEAGKLFHIDLNDQKPGASTRICGSAPSRSSRCLPGEAARGAGLRRAAPLRRARLPHRGRRGRVGLRARLHADVSDPQAEGAAFAAHAGIQAVLAEI